MEEETIQNSANNIEITNDSEDTNLNKESIELQDEEILVAESPGNIFEDKVENESEDTEAKIPEISEENQIQEEILEENFVQQEIPTIGSIANALKSDLKCQVEAVLFVTDKPLKTSEISKLLSANYDDIQSALVQLIQEYEDRNSALEIGADDGYIIQVKTQYLNIVTDMLPLELSAGPLRTLSAIALKEPCLQSIIIDMRGSSAYEHINELVEMDLITKKPQGLSFILKTTPKFNQYFRLSQEASVIKNKLQEEAKRRAKEKEKQLEITQTEENAENQTQEEISV